MPATNEQQNIAQAFLAARQKKTPLTSYPGTMPASMAEAYAIQDAAIASDGRRVGGWKVGRIAPELVGAYGDNRLTGPVFSDEIFDGSAGQRPIMPVYADGFAAAEAEVLLCLGDVGTRDYDLESVKDCIIEVRRSEERRVGKEC